MAEKVVLCGVMAVRDAEAIDGDDASIQRYYVSPLQKYPCGSMASLPLSGLLPTATSSVSVRSWIMALTRQDLRR